MKLCLRKFVDLILNLTILGMELRESWDKN